jgi:hypothetical protein
MGNSDRRRTTWARDNLTPTPIATGNHWETSDLLATFKSSGGNQQGVTIGRIHLRISIWSAVAEGDQIAIGVIRGQDTDVGTSVVGAPNPIANPYEDWLFWGVYTASDAGGSGVYSPHGLTNVLEFDIRAKRKLMNLDEQLQLVVMAAVVATSVSYSASVSTLLLLP